LSDTSAILVRLRWPNGVECPRCKMAVVELATAKQLFYCKACDYQFTVTANTIFNDSHLPLQQWFLAVLLLCEARKGFSANQMKRTLGVSYKTAWYLCHRIRHAMAQVERPVLDGTVEMDETYVGGHEHRGRGWNTPGNNKEVVVAWLLNLAKKLSANPTVRQKAKRTFNRSNLWIIFELFCMHFACSY
jgi:transposase-like protein